ncbi:UNVERIFIED_CONTAM: hypothetical protein FKN15_007619 [Acipenser sinensis]
MLSILSMPSWVDWSSCAIAGLSLEEDDVYASVREPYRAFPITARYFAEGDSRDRFSAGNSVCVNKLMEKEMTDPVEGDDGVVVLLSDQRGMTALESNWLPKRSFKTDSSQIKKLIHLPGNPDRSALQHEHLALDQR